MKSRVLVTHPHEPGLNKDHYADIQMQIEICKCDISAVTAKSGTHPTKLSFHLKADLDPVLMNELLAKSELCPTIMAPSFG